jgi:signal transduction histidine kinase
MSLRSPRSAPPGDCSAQDGEQRENALSALSDADAAELIAALAMAPDLEFLGSLVRYLRRRLGSDCVFVGEIGGENWSVVHTLALSSRDESLEPFQYELAGTPCAVVMSGTDDSACCYADGVADRFPEDEMLRDAGFESYAGIPLRDAERRPLGLIVSLGATPMRDPELAAGMLALFRERVAGVLALRRVNHDLHRLIEGTTEPTSRAIFSFLAGQLSRALHVRGALVAERTSPTTARSVAVVLDGEECPSCEYPLAGTPCEMVYRRGVHTQQETSPQTLVLPAILTEGGLSTYAGSVLTASSGEVIGHLAVVHDRLLPPDLVSTTLFRVFTTRLATELERKGAEDQRVVLIRELEARNAEMERFTYTVSHDLKSPLVTISGFSGLLRQDVEKADAEHVEEDLESIEEATARMKRLLDELLELSRIGRVVNPPEAVAAEQLAREALMELDGQIASRGVEVCVAPELPRIYGDALRLREVFQNLLSNAIKFMGDEAAPRVEIGCRPAEGESVITISDNGMGMRRAHLDRVFELFAQLDPRSEGTGIGLAITKRIVEAHDGRVWAESPGEGMGSTFCLALPFPPDD